MPLPSAPRTRTKRNDVLPAVFHEEAKLGLEPLEIVGTRVAVRVHDGDDLRMATDGIDVMESKEIFDAILVKPAVESRTSKPEKLVAQLHRRRDGRADRSPSNYRRRRWRHAKVIRSGTRD